jgi:nucleoside-diphosphate-sugar epimerase
MERNQGRRTIAEEKLGVLRTMLAQELADISKAKRLLKLESSVALEDGLKNMIPNAI